MVRPIEEWTRDELIAAVRKGLVPAGAGEREAPELLCELRLHQVELEMQNQELREAQRLLEESRGRYADLYDFAPVGYCTLDAQGVILEANMQVARLLGLERTQLIAHPFTSLVSTDVQRFQAHLRASRAQREPVTCELKLARRDLSSVVVQMVSTALPGGQACMTTLTDISQLKGSEQRLRLLSAVSAQLASALDYRATLPAVVRLLRPLVADVAFVDICDVDRRMERFSTDGRVALSDYRSSPQAEVLRLRAPLLVPVASAATLRAAAQPVTPPSGVAQGSLLILPMVTQGRGLGVFTFLRASPQGYSEADRSLAQEIADRVTMTVHSAHLYETAQVAIRGREDIVAAVSHDLHNPLQGIRLNCDHLLAAAPPTDRRGGRHQLEAIRRGIGRMIQMIDELSEVARIESGQLPLARSPHPLSELVGDALDLLRPLAQQKGVSLIEPPRPPEALLNCDRDRSLRVLSNIIGNAIKFTPTGGTVALDADLTVDAARFTVCDTGIGIEREELEHVFDRYWRASHNAGGSGLGLFIAKSIVEAHGGRIGMESEPGRGTTAWFTLPVAAGPSL